MEKDDDYSSTAGAEIEADRGSGSLQMQANLDYPSPYAHPICHGRPSTSYDDETVKAAAGVDINGQNSDTIHGGSGGAMVDYMLNNAAITNMIIPSYQQQPSRQEPNNNNMSAVEKTLSFADVMQFADLGPKLVLNHNHPLPHILLQQQQQQLLAQELRSHTHNRSDGDHASGIDPVSFLKFPVLSNQLIMPSGCANSNVIQTENDDNGNGEIRARGFDYDHQHHEGAAEYVYAQSTTATNNSTSHHYNNPVQLEFLGNATVNTSDENFINVTGDEARMRGEEQGGAAPDGKSSSSKRKRPRTIKTSEEVESQRMTHIAVERNRRKQMNEHLRVLRSLMPSSYVQRGDQASIIGGAIEFVRELEQLLQCLESQKRRRLYGDQQARPMGDSSSTLALVQQQPQQSLGFPCPLQLPTNLGCGVVGAAAVSSHHHEDDQLRLVGDHELDPSNNCMTVGEGGGGLLIQEETAESKSCIADVEVKMLGFDALIKILSRRRPGQLIKAIAALEELHLTILHTNITTIEQTVLYSFNVKVGSEARFTAEDIASSVQQIFTFIHANTNLT